MSKSQRWSVDAIRTARSVLAARLQQLSRMSESELRTEMRTHLGMSPDTSVGLEPLRRWLVDLAIDTHLPDSPPAPTQATNSAKLPHGLGDPKWLTDTPTMIQDS